MHDCRKTKEDLLDLVFNEVDAAQELQLLEEVEACRNCRAEYHSMQEALDGFDEAAHALMPTAEFWTEHHARVRERIDLVAVDRTATPFWRRALRTSFSIPVPAAIAAMLLLAATSVLAMRSFIIRPEAQSTAEASRPTVQYVEVPVEKRVVEERVVTRTVYVTKRGRPDNRPQPSLRDLPGMTAENREQNTNTTRATLNGFQPPSDVKLTVIKGSFDDEK